MGWIVMKLLSLGVPARFAKLAAWALVLCALIAALVIGKAIYDRSVIDKHEAKRLERSVDALDDAADQRSRDAIELERIERIRNDAIDSAIKGELGPSARAHACEQLRRQNAGRVPAGC